MVARVVRIVFVVGLAVEHVAHAVVPEAVSGQAERGNFGAVILVGEVNIRNSTLAYLNPYGYRLIACRSNRRVAACNEAVVHSGGSAVVELPYGVNYKQRLNGFRAEQLIPYRLSFAERFGYGVFAFEQVFKPCELVFGIVFGGFKVVAEIIFVYKSRRLVGVSLIVSFGIELFFVNDRGACAVHAVIRRRTGDIVFDVVVECAVNVVHVVVGTVIGALE